MPLLVSCSSHLVTPNMKMNFQVTRAQLMYFSVKTLSVPETLLLKFRSESIYLHGRICFVMIFV